jgi:hypothetical protein
MAEGVGLEFKSSTAKKIKHFGHQMIEQNEKAIHRIGENIYQSYI